MEIYITRHGETIWNALRKLQGRTDIELNENGRELAGITGRALEEVHFDAIYSSPLMRAYETAALMRGYRNIPIIRDERLCEICFGDYEGRNALELMQDETDPFHFFFSEPEKYRAPKHGETLEQTAMRAASFLKEVIEPLEREKHPERIMIAAHGAVNQGLMCHIAGRGIRDFWADGLQKNCSINRVELVDGVYRVLEVNRVFYEG